jgi:hypothetical protein
VARLRSSHVFDEARKREREQGDDGEHENQEKQEAEPVPPFEFARRWRGRVLRRILLLDQSANCLSTTGEASLVSVARLTQCIQ